MTGDTLMTKLQTEMSPEVRRRLYAGVAGEQINTSGVYPVEYKVLILPDDIHDTDPTLKKAREAGLYVADEVSEREQMSQVEGLLVAVGGNAFEDWKPPRPKVGDRVVIAQYAGLYKKGHDGKEYRLCTDKDIAALADPQELHDDV